MSLATIMLDQLAVARRIVEDGKEMVPAWRITTPEGTFLILTRFDTTSRTTRARDKAYQPVHGLEDGHQLRAYG